MARICPVCNEIDELKFPCDSCSGRMISKGRVQDYLDDYSADMPVKDEDIYCDHVYMCVNCGRMRNYNIKKVNC